MMTISQATKEDAPYIAPLIVDAIGDIAKRLTAQHEPTRIIDTLCTLIKDTNNRHSFEHTFVARDGQEIVGIAVLYDGKTGRTLDRELEQFLHTQGHDVTIDIEAHDDEFYIDTVSVHERAQGRGVGTQLLDFAEAEGKRRGFSKISLNVEVEKVRARQLYERLGYVTTENWRIIDEPFYHMVKSL